MDLTGRNAVVTGASSGIGAAIALELARNGANVAVCYHNNGEAAKDVANRIVELGCKAVALKADISDPAQVRSLMDDAASALGGIDILINNAGVWDGGVSLCDMDESLFDHVLGVNIDGTTFCIKYALPYLKRSGHGAVVSVASDFGHAAGDRAGFAYSASKSGVIGLTMCNCIDYGVEGVRFNVVTPGIVDSPMGRAMFGADSVRGSGVAAEGVAKLAAFLAGDGSSYMHGADVTPGRMGYFS